MASNLQLYSQMADDTARRITGSYQQWTAFLTTAARLYKYPYNEQLMIYAQRPNATACAEYGIWNDKMGRYVRRGSRGIALVDTSGYAPRMKYVFDVADTGGKENARSVNLWQFREEHEASVCAMLEQNYHIPAKGGLADQLSQIAEQMATAYWDDHNREILGIVADTEVRKKELFAKVRSGQVRVLMGSTFKMGAGMNVQDRLVALHDLDAPWRPGDLEQRSGRIIRQGNRNKEVHIYRYVTEGTFDAYLWQTLENKQKFISQIMTSKSPVRSCEDIDETALSYAEIKALCAGDERIKEKMDLDVDVARLKLMRANHQSQQYKLEDNILRYFPEQIEQAKEIISGLKADMQTLAAHPHPKDGFAGMEIRGNYLTDKENAGAALLDTLKEVKGLEPLPVGSYRGLQMTLTVENFGRDYILTMKGQLSYRAELGHDPRGNLTRIENVLNSLPERLTVQQDRIESLRAQTETAKAELGKPFPQETELREKSMRLAQLNAELNIDERTLMEQLAEDEPVVAKSPRPSVLQKLRSPLPEQKCEQKSKSKEMEI